MAEDQEKEERFVTYRAKAKSICMLKAGSLNKNYSKISVLLADYRKVFIID